MSAEKQKNILLVEDEAIIAMTEKALLEKFGYRVQVAHGGEEAITTVAATPGIDLILMDINLGAGMDGTDAAAMILKTQDIPVVFLSSHTEPEVVEKTEKITSYGYVVKNSSATVLDASIKMAFKLFAAKMRERKKEAALAHSNQLMKYIIEHMHSAVAVHDRDLKYIYVSQRYLDDYKVKEQDIIGRHHYDVFPDLPQKWRDVHNRALAGEISMAEDDPYEREDGTVEWTRWECRPWYTADGSIGGIIIYTEVTTGRKQAEIKLAQSHDLLTKLARLVPGVVYQYRLDPDGCSAFPYASPGMNDIYEVTPEEVRDDATPVFARLHPDDYDRVAGAIQASALTLNTFYCEFRVLLPRQGLRWRWSQAQPERLADGGTLWHGIISDITERKLAEEALHESEERMRAIVEGTPHLFFYTQDAAANTTYVSPTIEQITGYKPDVWLKRRDWFITDAAINQEAKARTQAHLQGNFSDKPVLLEIHHSLGHEILLEIYEYPITQDGRIVGLQGVALDITEREQAQAALLENNSRLELAMQAADMAWWEMDLPGGHVTFAKRKAEMLGYPAEKFKHYRDFVALVHPDDRDKVMAAMRRHLDGSLPRYQVDYRIAASSGAYVWFHDIGSVGKRDASGKPLNVTGLVINISGRKQAEEALRASEANQSNALQMTRAGHWEYDVDRDLFTFNDNFYRIFRTTAAAVGGYQMPAEDYARRFCHPDDAAQVGEETRAAIASSDPDYSRQIEHRILYADGEIGYIAVRFFIVKDPQGRTIRTYGVNQDISERKWAEEEIKRQLAEKELLLREVHHRIKNNFASIGGLLSLHMQASTSPEAVAALQDAIGRVDSMSLLYEKLLLGEDFRDASVKNYIESLATSVVSLFPDLAKVKLNLDVVDFKLDPKRLFPLGIIINELLTNIMKHAFAGKKSGTITLTLAKDGARVRLNLEDNGVGLPVGFASSASKGFGLTLVKMLSKQLGGSFTIARDKGTRCTVTFDV
jgi:PAS domain S-box-containing protein